MQSIKCQNEVSELESISMRTSNRIAVYKYVTFIAFSIMLLSLLVLRFIFCFVSHFYFLLHLPFWMCSWFICILSHRDYYIAKWNEWSHTKQLYQWYLCSCQRKKKQESQLTHSMKKEKNCLTSIKRWNDKPEKIRI